MPKAKESKSSTAERKAPNLSSEISERFSEACCYFHPSKRVYTTKAEKRATHHLPGCVSRMILQPGLHLNIPALVGDGSNGIIHR